MANGPNSNIPYELELTVGPITVNGNGTTIVPATNTTLGGVIIPDGGGLSIDSGGNLTATAQPLNPATNTTLGGVIIPDGGGLSIDSGGNLTATAQPLNPATNTTLGGVIVPDGGGLSITPEGNLTVANGAFVPTTGSNGNSVLSMPGYGLEVVKPTTNDPAVYNNDALNLQTSGIYTSYDATKDGNILSFPSITFGSQGSISLISKYHNATQSGLWYNTGLNITPYSVQVYTNAGLDMSNPNAVVYKSYADARYQANGTTMPYPNYNGTNLESVPFVGSGLADTSNTACSVAIGLIPEYNGYKVYGAFSNYNNTLQINGLTDIYTNGLLAPSLAAGNQANGTGGIYAVPGDCRLINTGNPQTSSSVVSKGYVDSKFGSLPYLNNSTTNSTYTFTDTATDSRLQWVKTESANVYPSERWEWLDNTGRYGTLQWVLKPTGTQSAWSWGGVSINASTSNLTNPDVNLYVNYSDSFAAGNAYGRGIRVTPYDVTLTTNVLGAGVLPAKQWTANSILTQSYADTRYSLVNTSVPLVSTTGTVFSSTSFTGGQFGYANATSGILTGVATVSGTRYGQIQFRNNSNLTNTVRVSVNAAELISIPANTSAPMSRVAVDQSAATLMYSDTFLNTAQLAISNTANGIVCLLQGVMDWQDDSVLTRTYADTRYVNEPANGTFTGTFLSQDGKTVTVQNGVIVSVA